MTRRHDALAVGTPRIFAKVFERMVVAALDEGARAETSGLALALFAMKYLAETLSQEQQAGQDAVQRAYAWQPLQWSRELPHDLLMYATRVDEGVGSNDRSEPSLGSVLLRGIERVTVPTLRRWVDELAGVPLWEPATQGEAFAGWFNETLDDLFLQQRAGGFSTPPSIAQLMVTLAEIEPGERVLDPFAGNGALLSTVAARASSSFEEQPEMPPMLFGQEQNRMACAWARLRLLIRDQVDATIVCANSFAAPAFVNGARLEQFDVVLCNGPTGTSRPAGLEFPDPYGRFLYGPTAITADAAVIQHVIASLADHGRAVVAMPFGFLFRGGAEAWLRRKLIENGLIRAVIGLPGGTFIPSTNIPLAILVLGKGESARDRVLFVDASDSGSKGRGRVTLDSDAIKGIHECVSRAATGTLLPDVLPVPYSMRSTSEIAAQDNSLQPQRYVETVQKDPLSSLARIRADIEEVEAQYRRASQEVEDILKRLT